MKPSAIFTPALFLAALVAAPGCKDTTLSGLIGNRETIAELKEPRADVKLRRAHQMAWTGAEEGSGLSSYDALKTGQASSGLIKYTDDSVLRLGENSMVIVVDRTQKKDSEQSVVALPSGSVEGRVSGNSEKKIDIEIRTPRGWIKASNQTDTGAPNNFKFKTSLGRDGAMTVQADSGEVKFVAKGLEQKISKDLTLTLPADPNYRPPPDDGDNKAVAGSMAEPPELKDRAWNTGEPLNGASSAEPGVDLFLIKEPRDRAMVSEDIIKVRGELSGRLKAYLFNTQIIPDGKGLFSVAVRLERGANTLEFRIVSPSGKEQEETLTVIRK